MKFVGHIDDEDLLEIIKSANLSDKKELESVIAKIKKNHKKQKPKPYSASQIVGEQSFRFQAGVNYDWDEMQCLSQFFPKNSYRLSEPTDFHHSRWGVRMLTTVEIKVDVALLGD